MEWRLGIVAKGIGSRISILKQAIEIELIGPEFSVQRIS
jgi:hypothetical protein